MDWPSIYGWTVHLTLINDIICDYVTRTIVRWRYYWFHLWSTKIACFPAKGESIVESWKDYCEQLIIEHRLLWPCDRGVCGYVLSPLRPRSPDEAILHFHRLLLRDNTQLAHQTTSAQVNHHAAFKVDETKRDYMCIIARPTRMNLAECRIEHTRRWGSQLNVFRKAKDVFWSKWSVHPHLLCLGPSSVVSELCPHWWDFVHNIP